MEEDQKDQYTQGSYSEELRDAASESPESSESSEDSEGLTKSLERMANWWSDENMVKTGSRMKLYISPLRMTGSSKLLASKEIRYHKTFLQHINLSTSHYLTHCSYAIVERIVMSKRKATEELAPPTNKKSDTSTDYVYHTAARKGAKVYKSLLQKLENHQSISSL